MATINDSAGKYESMSDFKLILFDVGNVLVKLTGADIIIHNSRKKLTKEFVMDTWTSIDGVIGFETGVVDDRAFSSHVIEYYDLAVGEYEFVDMFRSAAERKYDGVDEFLSHLGKHYELCCLTNTNPIQWPKIKTVFGLDKYFAKQYVSYEIGFIKPDQGIYKYVLDDTGHDPASILFVDDNIDNCSAGERQGFQCRHVEGFDDAKRKICELISIPTQQTNARDGGYAARDL